MGSRIWDETISSGSSAIFQKEIPSSPHVTELASWPQEVHSAPTDNPVHVLEIFSLDLEYLLLIL